MLSSPATGLDEVDQLNGLYGREHRLCSTPSAQVSLVLSLEREIDLFELEQLCDAVG